LFESVERIATARARRPGRDEPRWRADVRPGAGEGSGRLSAPIRRHTAVETAGRTPGRTRSA